MKKQFLKFSLVALTVAVVFSCKDDKKATVLYVTPSEVRDIVFSTNGATATAGEKPFAPFFVVTTNAGTWDAVSSETSWLTVNKSGTSFTLTAQENEKVPLRSAKITVTSGEATPAVINVTQDGATPTLSLSSTEAVFFNTGGTAVTSGTLVYTVETDYSDWDAVSNQTDWLTVNKSETGFTLSAGANKDISRRDATVTVTAGTALPVVLQVSQEGNSLRVASYNILYDSWQSRATMVKNLIRQYDFDIFGVQEAYYNPHLIDLTGDGVYAYTGQGRDGGTNNEHSAILYKKARFELLSSGDFWFSTTPDKASFGWDAEFRRICSWGKFREKDSKREFYFFNSHFDHKGGTARRESGKLLLSKIKAIAGSNMPVFATGDFNAEPQWPELFELMYDNDGLLKDAYSKSEKKPYGTYETAHGFNPPNPSSTHRIDYILVTKDIRVKEYGVLNDRPNGQYPSDHDPVLVVVEF